MVRPSDKVVQVEAELTVSAATAQLVRFQFPEPLNDLTYTENSCRLDLCLTPRPRNARACYPDLWNPQRFEQIGNLFLLPAGLPMCARSDDCCEQTSIVCELHPEYLQAWFDDELEWTDRRLMAALDIRNASIQNLLLRLAQEVRQPGFAGATLVELIAAQLAIELSRYCSDVEQAPVDGGLESWRLRLIDERLQDVSEAPTLTELADLCRVSVRRLTGGFRASRGRSIGEHIAESRVALAKQLLATEKSVKAIALSLGFASPSSFCYAFRRATGETPGRYRERRSRPH